MNKRKKGKNGWIKERKKNKEKQKERRKERKKERQKEMRKMDQRGEVEEDKTRPAAPKSDLAVDV